MTRISIQQKYKDTNGITRSPKSQKNRQYNGQNKKDEKDKQIYKTLHRKLKIEQHEPH